MNRTAIMFLLMVMFLPSIHMFAQDQPVLPIVNVSTTNFPTITFRVPSFPTAAESATLPQVSLGDQVMSLTTVEQMRLPLNVSIVADLSNGMSTEMQVGITRLNAMQQRLRELIWRLQSEQNSVSLTLIRDTVVLAHERTSDLGDVDNTIANGNASAPFTMSTQAESATPSGRLMQEALTRGLALLEAGDASSPRILVVFASADTWQAADILALKPFLETMRHNQPVELIVVGFGGSGVATELEQAAQQLGAEYIRQDNLESHDQKAALYTTYKRLTELGHLTEVRFVANAVPPGETILRVRMGAASGEQHLSIPPFNPVVGPLLASDQLSNTVRIGAHVSFSQTPLQTIDYLLDGRSLKSFGEMQTDQTLILDTTSQAFRQQFPTNQSYPLVVAATDKQGLASRSEPLMVAVLKSPSIFPSGWSILTFVGILIILIVIALVGLGLYRVFRRGPIGPKRNPTTRQSIPSVVDELPDNGKGETLPQGRNESPTKPQRPDSPMKTNWRLEFIAGAGRDPEVLRADRGMRYSIGRPYDTSVPTGIIHISVHNDAVTRGAHATLFLKGNGEQLVLKANPSSNPVYIGDGCEREILADQEITLESGESFWLSTAVQIRVTREVEQHA